ncbi:disease resistance protein L6-like [Syzygium oleosum]|uniref:disease resistance protein L6-like n=1 Tax=Syzygium oleosum TaxID=219896 RepID=UPI0024B8979F|nr:disease resistance protein L6-like [Syzygium oleosum]
MGVGEAMRNPLAVAIASILLAVLAPRFLKKKETIAGIKPDGPILVESAPSASGNDYEVFLSFRGRDTRTGLTDYLYNSLVDAGVSVFRDDDELRIGEKIGPDLLRAIKSSKISIPILSPDYASSKWCLRELARMIECKRSEGHVVLPIFYKVEPGHVRHQTGSFGKAFHTIKKHHEAEVVRQWERALQEVGSLKGWESERIANGHEAELVKIIVRKVLGELKEAFQLDVTENLVGISNHVEEIMRMLSTDDSDTRFVGILGIGGAGKTTLAKVMYNKLSSQFDHCSFLADVRETSKERGAHHLQNQLISDILKGKHNDVSNVDEGLRIIKTRFRHKKVLILLDDVDDVYQLNCLAGKRDWFASGSKIIITARKLTFLDEPRVDNSYELNGLDPDNSLLLFSRHAFRRDFPLPEFGDLSRDIVSTTGGLPLALEVIGSFLCGKRLAVWKDTLKKLRKIPHTEVQEKLRVSYEALDYEQKQIFLDIACFFAGTDGRIASYMWDDCEFFPGMGIEALSLMSLIKVGNDHRLLMHDQLRDLGREIVRQENYDESWKRSRLWIHKEALHVLEKNKGSKKIKALCLNQSGLGRVYSNKPFEKLPKLRFLEMNNLILSGDFEYLLSELRWLYWKNCPPNFVATNFHAEKLVVLDLSRSKVTDHWEGWNQINVASNLKVLNTTNCQDLKTSPDLTAFKNLEILILEKCEYLTKVHPSIGNISTLISLDVRDCFRLKELPIEVSQLQELEELFIDRTRMEEIHMSKGSMKKLRTLSAKYCESLARISSSLSHLASLSTLDFTGCKKLAELPDSIGCLQKLQCLSLKECSSLRGIPNSIGKLESLIELDISYTSFTELPESIGDLCNLEVLQMARSNVKRLPSAIGMLGKLTELDATNCNILGGEVCSDIGELSSLRALRLFKTGIYGLPESICKLSCLQDLDLRGCNKLQFLPNLPSGLRTLGLTCQSPTLPVLSNLINLKELSVMECCTLECLQELPSELLKLSVTACQMLRKLPDLSNLKHLSVLSLKVCSELREVKGLEGLVSLTMLDVLKCPKLSRLDGVECLMSLRYLSIGPSEALERLMDRLELSNLKVLPSCENQVEIQVLNSFICLEVLDLTDCKSMERLDLSSLKLLRKANVKKCKNLVEIRGLDSLEYLERLDISECTSIKRLDIAKLKYLRYFWASKCKNLCEVRGLDVLEYLEWLDISGCTSIETLPDLSCFKTLKFLNINHCEKLRDIQTLEKFSSCQWLYIDGCKSLEKLPNLSKFEGLIELIVKDCHELLDISELKELRSLEFIDMSRCKSIEHLPDLSLCKNLKCLVVRDCEKLIELTGLGDLASLWQVDISGCKSLTIPELPGTHIIQNYEEPMHHPLYGTITFS